MAAKTIHEAVQIALLKGPQNQLKNRAVNELRDFFAHRVMILGEEASALDLFNDVFKDVPAFKGGSDDK